MVAMSGRRPRGGVALTRRAVLFAALLIAPTLASAACAGGAGSAPSEDDVSDRIDLVPETGESRDRALAWLGSQQDESQGFRVTLDEDYGVEYVGPVAGSVADIEALGPSADPGVTPEGPASPVAGVEVRILSRTDVDYLQDVVPLRRDGTFSAPLARRGEKIARLVRASDGRVISSSEWSGAVGLRGLPRSFVIPRDDPDYGDAGGGTRQSGYRLEQRSFVYDAGLAVLALTQAEDFPRAREILRQLSALQHADGSLSFSYDVFLGAAADRSVRSGALAWVGTAAVEYERATGDTGYRSLAEGVARYLLAKQVTEVNGYELGDPRYGSVLGGEGRYLADGGYAPETIAWASTEHNIDAYFFLRDLGYVTKMSGYVAAADLVKQSLLTNHWNAGLGRFDQGVGDPARALDLVSWGGLFLRAIGEDDTARQQLALLREFRVEGTGVTTSSDPESYNQTYRADGPIGGYKPYAESPGTDDAPPETVWAEGTWGAILLRLRLGEDAGADIDGMLRLQSADPRGGFLQVTRGRRSPPYELHAWPAVGGTAWAAIVLGGSEILWRSDGWASRPAPRADGDQTTGTP